LALLLCATAGAGENAPADALLARFPAPSPAARDKACAAIVAKGAPAYADVLARVLPPGAGDDARARYAVNGLATYVTRPGADRERAVFAQSLLSALGAARDREVAAFLLTQVQVVGRGESVRPLARYLHDERLAGPATSALLTIGTPEVDGVLLKAVDKAPAAVVPSLVNALGARKNPRAVRKLLPLADSADPTTRQAALAALATIGDPAAAPVLSKTRLDASFRERAAAPGRYLAFARRLLETGRSTEALAAARSVLENYRQPGEAQHAAEALTLIADARKTEALPDLLAAAAGPEPTLRGQALALAERIPGEAATARWLVTAQAAPAPARAAIVEMLGSRGDRSALPFARESLQSPDEAVRVAAISAVVRLGGEAGLNEVLPLFARASAAESAALKTALLRFPAGVVVPRTLPLLEGSTVPARIAIVQALGEKGAREAFEPVLRLTEDPEAPVRETALAALGNIAGEAEIPKLVAMLDRTSAGDEVVRLREAIAAAVMRNPDPERRADGLLELLEKAPPSGKVGLLRLLPRVGGARSLEAAARETRSADAEVQAAAISALARWPDAAASEALLGVAQSSANPAHVRSALQGYARLIARSELPTFRKMAAFEKALAVPAAQDADRKALVTALSSIREPESLRLLGRSLDDPRLRDAASAALLDLASRQSDEEPWLSGHEAYSILRRVEALAGDSAVRARAASVIPQRLKQGGFVPLFNGRDLEGWETGAGAEVHWRVKEGVLVSDGGGDGLRARGEHGDFELLLDAADAPDGPWRSVRVFLVGERLTAYVDDERVLDNAALDAEGAGQLPIVPGRPLALRSSGSPRALRNLHLRAIARDPAAAPLVTDEAEGFTALFNGRDLDGWTGSAASYVPEGGRIVVHPERGGGNLYTAREYTDFVLRFEFKLTPAANNGLGVRAPLEGDAAYVGMELQILEDGSPVYWGLEPYQYHGSVYGVVPAKRGVLRPVGEWNGEEVTVQGRHVTVVVNGITVVDADLDTASAGGTLDHKDHPGLARQSGHIGFLGHGSALELRNIRIRELR
jgi:HEAT repeat protein